MSVRHNHHAIVAPLTFVSGIAYLIRCYFIVIEQKGDDILNNLIHVLV